MVIRPEDGRRCARAVVAFLQGVAAEIARKADAQRAIEAAAEASRQAALREEKEAKKYVTHIIINALKPTLSSHRQERKRQYEEEQRKKSELAQQQPSVYPAQSESDAHSEQADTAMHAISRTPPPGSKAASYALALFALLAVAVGLVLAQDPTKLEYARVIALRFISEARAMFDAGA